MLPVEEQRRLHLGEPPPHHHLVHEHRVRLRVAPQQRSLLEDRAADDTEHLRDLGAVGHVTAQPLVGRGVVVRLVAGQVGAVGAVLVDLHRVGEGQGSARVGVEQGDAIAQEGRGDEIVVGHPLEQLAVGCGDQRVVVAVGADIGGVPLEADPRVPGGVLLDDGDGLVRRPVVGHEDGEVLVRLGEHRVECLTDVAGAIEHRHPDDQALVGHRAARAPTFDAEPGDGRYGQQGEGDAPPGLSLCGVVPDGVEEVAYGTAAVSGVPVQVSEPHVVERPAGTVPVQHVRVLGAQPVPGDDPPVEADGAGLAIVAAEGEGIVDHGER